jgi:type IV pilus assembly protein PilA
MFTRRRPTPPRRTFRPKDRRVGFTIIELMITVAVVGLLSAIAIPGFMRYQIRTKAAEARTSIGSIRTAEEAYFAEVGFYAPALPTPAGLPDQNRHAWPTPSDFDTFGWQPIGGVLFQYAVTVSPDQSAYTVEAMSDLDANGVFSLIGYVKDSPSGSVPGVLGCSSAGVWDPATSANALLDQPGPCDANSGVTVF